MAELPEPRPALVVLPTFNEIENLEKVVAGIRAAGHHVLVVDDASPDGTGELADRLAGADSGCVSVLHRPQKQGLGTAYKAGFGWGLERGYELLVEMDADGSHLPVYVGQLVASSRETGGLALGSRWIPGGSVVGWGPARYILSVGANWYCRALLRMPVRDATTGFRCYQREVLEKIDLDTVISEGYSFQIEMVYRALRLGYRVTEIPIRFEDRVAGRSKVSRREVTKALGTVLKLRLRNGRY
ncbi:MAG TPA: polyprenol monophosphomannose synthase [Candidatus Dormibacteraeota bacterium]